MNEIAFVIAVDDFGVGELEGIEPIIDGVSVVDLLKWQDGEISFAGLVAPERFLQEWQRVLLAGGSEKMQILGCCCGNSDCQEVTVRVDVDADAVVWSEFWGRIPPAGEPHPRIYEGLGPYRFTRQQYSAALAEPVYADAPIRERHETAGLAAGLPTDPADWLRAMTLAFGRDFLTPYQPESTKEVVASGLRSLKQAGQPLTAKLVRDWARDRRFTDEAVERYVDWFHEIAPRS